MRNLLVHGCYDRATLDTLIGLGINRLAFDLRATSLNLIPFNELESFIKTLPVKEFVLTFQDDKASTVLAFLDLLKSYSQNILLEFRDQRELNYYHSIGRPFLWMFHPQGDWRNILMLPNLKGVLLPINWQSEYQKIPMLWHIIEERKLEVFVHASRFEETTSLTDFSELNLSLDLTSEIETSFRCVDQERLKRMQIWRKFNENPSL